MWITLALMAGVIVLYVTEWLSLELTSLLLLSALLLLFHVAPVTRDGEVVLEAADLVRGFANPALLTVLALLVVGEAMIRTGALDSVAEKVGSPRMGVHRGIVMVLLGVAVLSAFLNNTPVVVIFIPIMQALARSRNWSPSRLMMPLSFAAILGGMTTLIGSSTNLLVSSALIELGREELGFFEFLPIALVLASIGMVYTFVVAPRLLPSRQPMSSRMAGGGKQFVSQIVVPEDSPLVGQKAAAGKFKALPDITVRLIQRGEHAELPPFDDFPIRAGDVLVIAATRSALTEVASRQPGLLFPPVPGRDSQGERIKGQKAVQEGAAVNGAEAGEDGAREDEGEDGEAAPPPELTEMVLVEAMVSPASRLIGLTLEQYGIRQRHRCLAVGILRRARMIRARMTEIRLEAGDVILLLGRSRDIDGLRGERDLVIMSGTRGALPRRHLAKTAGAIFAATVGLAALGLIPILAAAIIAATALIGVGAINLRQAARALDRKIILVVVAALALGDALQATGGARWIAEGALAVAGDMGPVGVLSAFFLLVAMFTNILTNNATAVLFTPIGISLAEQMGTDPRIFAITVVLAGNCSFASPIGYKTNLLIMGPGQYHFADFVKAGLPLVILLWIVFTLFAPVYWSL
ncbi:SLC13 family permease [Caenispirillum salinarum]|uniref:SLC13 family permease n=1 Tax=Caenispirillum salinarum TaxID=859058 RepID=UPI00384AAF7B